MAYTVTYPFGVIGPILVIVALRRIFQIRIPDEVAALAAAERIRRPPIEAVDFLVTQPAQAGLKLRDHPLLHGNHVVLSRLIRDDTVTVPTGDTEVHLGDVYRAVGPHTNVATIVEAMGRVAEPEMLAQLATFVGWTWSSRERRCSAIRCAAST